MLLYYTPEQFGYRDCLRRIESHIIEACMDFAAPPSRIPCDNTAYELLILYMEEHNLIMPTDAYKGLNLYNLLRNALRHDLNLHC